MWERHTDHTGRTRGHTHGRVGSSPGLRIGRLETLIVLVGIYTFFVTFKPSEPFLVIFLRCVKKISRDDVSFAVFPIWTPALAALLPIMCALAELIGYKLVVVLGAACRLITVMVLLVPFTDHLSL